MKRFLALALSLVMILGALLMAGCDENTPVETTAKPQSTTASTSGSTNGGDGTTSSSSSDNGDDPSDPGDDVVDPYAKLKGYEDVSFGGKTIVIAGCDGEADGFDSAKEIYSEESDRISIAVNERNLVVQQLYDCIIEGKRSASPAGDVSAEVTSNQHTIDIYNHHYAITGVATGGQAYNLYTLGSRDIDFTQDWWDQQYVNTYSIKNSSGTNTLYSIIGDFALTAFDCTHAIVYNKTVYANDDDLSSIDIYQLVRDKKWTMDQFMFMVKNGAHDANGNSSYAASEGDVLGWIRTGHATHGLHVASGLSIISNNNGAFTFNVLKEVDSWTPVIDKAIEVWAMPEGQTLGYSDIPATIAGGNALFASEIIGSSLANLKDYDCEIGLLPYPLHSENQDNYSHYVDNHVYSYSVPTSVTETEMIGDFLTVYAYHSKYLVRPVYVNVYAYDYCSDADSEEMLNLILDTMTYDPGYLSASLEGEISNFISNGKNNVSKFASGRANKAEEWITEFMTKLNKNAA